MSKVKSVYVCQSCAFESAKWVGKCPSCEAWNSFVEDVVSTAKSSSSLRGSAPRVPLALTKEGLHLSRLATGIGEWDQVLGGGFVSSQLVLLSGEPGIGKSTLTLQITGSIAQQKEKVLYVTGEESTDQVADRARRLGIQSENLILLYENDLNGLLSAVEREKPNFLVVDSVQVMASPELTGTAGSISQVRYVTEQLIH